MTSHKDYLTDRLGKFRLLRRKHPISMGEMEAFLTETIQQSMEVGREEGRNKIEETSPSYEGELSRLLQHLEGMEFLSPTTRRDIEILVIKTVRQQIKAFLTSEVEKERERLFREIEKYITNKKDGFFLERDWEEMKKALSDIGGGK